MVTRGQRRLGRMIRTLENSVEFSAKEVEARKAEEKCREEIVQDFENSPVQNFRYLVKKKIRTS